jgi:hypothetical protein
MPRLAFAIPLLLIPAFYFATLARTVVLGDPAEYTFVSYILGIAHPPGYAFLTLLGKAFQTLIPFGEIAWRMHLLSAVAGTAAALFVYATLQTATSNLPTSHSPLAARHSSLSALFAALTVALAANFWQHSIHANPHIITATFLAANLFFLTKWAAGQSNPRANVACTNNRWLYAFSLSAGLGITHHPLTVMAFPAYLLFILWVRPAIWREWRTLLKVVVFGLLGLSVWLYFPIRSPMELLFGPSTMNTLSGFLDHVLARGLSESLPYFALADVPDRALVFWTLLRLQYSLPVIFLAFLGLLWLLVSDQKLTQRRRGNGLSHERQEEKKNFAPFASLRESTLAPKLALLYGLAFLSNYAFVMSLRAQDVMAYLLGVFLIVGLLSGFGLYGLLALTAVRLRAEARLLGLLAGGLFLLGPGLQLARNAPRISLSDYNQGEAYVTAVFERFAGREEGTVLLNDWEHMTPLWYARFVERRWPEAADVRPELVSTARPWVESVFDYLPGGPVYLSNYRREIVDAGFRLRPDGPFYQVVEPGVMTIPSELETERLEIGRVREVEIVGYLLPERAVTAGDYVPLTLAMRAPEGTADYDVPVVRIGDVLTYTFTTDSHLVTPEWRKGEVIVERFDFALPHDLAAGTYPVTVGLKNLSRDEETATALPLGELAVMAQAFPVDTSNLLGNFRQRVGLSSATARINGQRVRAPWTDPLIVQPGDTVYLTLQWKSLALAEESYTVFLHLIDQANRPLVTLDYTPLGGSTPTHLWIPKWLPEQKMLDPYRLTIPADTPPGDYFIEVGLYEMVSGRRLHLSDAAGNLTGDRLILGPVVVEE